MGRIFTFFTAAFLLFFSSACFSQQKEPADSLIRMLEANSAHLQEINGVSYRKVVGPARFLHNNTYLLCDTALWNVNTNIIDAIGHVQIIQENTFLRSDRIEYVVNENLAKVRGSIVELFDKEGNILRTNYLDYNTKDSIGTFFHGGALSNHDGNLIESLTGLYLSKEKTFSFYDQVNMFADSVFIKSEKIDYRTDLNKAYFGPKTTAWQNENILFANAGEFDRPGDIFTFSKDGYILTEEQEIWADLLNYFRKTGDADLYSNVQILDTVQTAIALADKATYRPNPMVVELTQKPAIGLYSVENGVKDTLFMRADSMKYYTKRYCDVDSAIVAQAKARKELSDIDPIAEVEGKNRKPETLAASIAADSSDAKKAIPADLTKALPVEEKKQPPALSKNSKLKTSKKLTDSLPSVAPPDTGQDTTRAAIRDSIGNKILTDTLHRPLPNTLGKMAGDSLGLGLTDTLGRKTTDTLGVALPPAINPQDTVTVAFIDAFHHVKFFRNDLQGICDSLVYTGIDSIARFYKDPVMWNEIKNQFTADSMQVVIKNGKLNKANLLSNAYIISQEDSIHFNQVKSPEMTAFFANNDLYRFDALGGVSAIFFLQEDSIITIMNQKESKMLSVKIKERKVQRLKYIEQIKNDALPVYNLPADQQKLRGFVWRDGDRPKTRGEITDRSIRQSQRDVVMKTEFPQYTYAMVYFPQRRDSIMAYKSYTDSLKRENEQQKEKQRLNKAEQDRLEKEKGMGTDSLGINVPGNELLPDGNTGKEETDLLPALGGDKSDSLANPLSEKEKKRLEKKREKSLRKEEKRLKKEQIRLEKEKKRLEKNEARLRERENRSKKK